MKPLTPQNELYEKLALLGWSLQKIEFKNGLYIARAANETTGQDIERAGKSPELALASVYQYAARASEVRRFAAVKKLGAWNDHWTHQIEDIANAYRKLPVFDEKAVEYWKTLAAESKIQADAIRKQIKVDVVDDPEPYPNAQAMCEDVHKNKHFYVSRANSEHPLWSVDDNVNFRIVHDVLGHCQSGGDFSWHGENLACGVHFPLVSPQAREALMTECLGQTAYGQHFHGFGPQKIGLMSEFLHPAQAKEGEHIWVPHGGLPELAMAPNQNARGTMGEAPGMAGVFNSPGDWVQPGMYQPSPLFGPTPVMQGYQIQGAKMVSPNRPHDPNAFWNPPTQVPPIAGGSPQDYIGIGDTVGNAAKVDTGWQSEDPATQDRAIMNAFRVALLSPRKHLRWNAAHYQALMNADPGTKAVDLWDMLEKERERHNQSLGFPEGSHLAYKRQLDFLGHELQSEGLSPADALAKAKQIIFDKTKEFEAGLGPEHGQQSELARYNQARKLVTEWLRENYTPLRGWSPGQLALANQKTSILGDDWGYECPKCGGKDTEYDGPLVGPGVWACNDCGWRFDPDNPHDDAVWHPDPEEYGFTHDAGMWGGHEHPPTRVIPALSDREQKLLEDTTRLLPESEWPDWMKRYLNYQAELATKKIQNDTTPSELTFPGEWVAKTANDTLFDPEQVGGWKPIDQSGFSEDTAKYGAFMGAHLDAIAEVGQHIDEIRKAALEDIQHGGKGFIFRNAVMNMNLPGVNPKVASFAWLLLAPMTSELGIIDTHIIRGLRRNESDMTPRDYYKMERMQRAAKDATGYSHMPLGMYHWGLWDLIRNPGVHSDHSPLRVLDPLPWDSPDARWDASTTARSGPWVGPMEFENGRGAMEQAANDFDQEFAGQPANLVPQAGGPVYDFHSAI